MDMKKITAALLGVGAITLPQLSFSSTDALDKVDYISVSISSSDNSKSAVFNNGRSQAEIRVKLNVIPGMKLTQEDLDDLSSRLTIHNRIKDNVKEGDATEDEINLNENQFYIQEVENIYDQYPSYGKFHSSFAVSANQQDVNNTVYRYVTATGMPQGGMEVCAMIDDGKSYGGVEFNTCNDENSPKLEVRESLKYSSDDLRVENASIQYKDGLKYKISSISLHHPEYSDTKIRNARVIGQPFISKTDLLPEGVMLRGAFKIASGKKVDGSEGGTSAANYLMRPLHLYENAPQANHGILPLMAGCWIPGQGSEEYYKNIDPNINWSEQPIRLPSPRVKVTHEPVWSENVLAKGVLSSGSLNCVRFEVRNESTETRRKMPLTVNYPLPFNRGKLTIYDNYGNKINAIISSTDWDINLSVH